MTQEIWKNCIGYENIYEVSNKGNIRTHKNKVTYTKKHGKRHWQQRILKQKLGQKNSFRVELWKDGKHKTWLVHRLVAIAFIPNPENLATVNHKDGNRQNNCVENLEWLSLSDNIKHGFKNGLYKNQKPIKIINKETKESKEFRNMALGNKYLGYNHSYLSGKIKNDIYENEKYIWELM